MSNWDSKLRLDEEVKSENIHPIGSAIICKDNVIEKIVTSEEAVEEFGIINHSELVTLDLKGKAIVPGFVDAHTHLIWAGDRSREVSWRMEGHSYSEIASMGGGINYTVKATRESSNKELKMLGLSRLRQALRHGTTHLEAKSGYGLDTETELKLLEVAQSLEIENNIPSLTHTWLGAHSTPQGLTREQYVEEILSEQLPSITEQGIAQQADVFCEEGWFTLDETEQILTQAKNSGLDLRIHIDEFKDCGGGELAADLKVRSADHAHHTSDYGRQAMDSAGVNTGFLPGTPYSMGELWPDFNEMVDNRYQFSFGSDFNPNCRTLSLPFMGSIAVQRCGLDPLIALSAVTVNPAKTLDRNDGLEQGVIKEGAVCNLNILNSEFWQAWALQPGISPIETTILEGNIIQHQQ
tara:strand:+ start:3160 stop:4386 length:1227 start_codon:yes stop_codon:yes gene_type:complete